MLRFFKKYHKWLSLTATFFILLFAISGIILNHRGLLARFDLSRKLLPPVYRYANWNLASVKGAVPLSNDSLLIYGNIGAWMTHPSFRKFNSLNQGFPKGVDNRKINTVYYDSLHGLFAGTLFGLYQFDFGQRHWKNIPLPSGNERVVRILSVGDALMVMSRSYLMISSLSRLSFRIIDVPEAEGWDRKVGLFKTFWVLHSGEIYGIAGKLIIDAVGSLFILLCITGLIYFFVPYRLKYLKDDRGRSNLKRFNRQSLRWHNVAGSWAILILLLTTFTGMFLRPPLLIPIASSRVDPIPYSELDNPNPWFDKFRDFHFDKEGQRFLIATNEGIFEADRHLRGKLRSYGVQPPVSVMGINVLEKSPLGGYLVGSFSGIYRWDPNLGEIHDHITKLPYTAGNGGGPPFGEISVAGYIRINDSTEVVFDYANGVMSVKGRNPLPAMPSEIIEQNPISLWNTALEIHTGRIFQPLIGEFYILVVPLVGLATLFILVSGFFSWWLAKRRR